VELKLTRSTRLGVLYALGHAVTVALLGSAVIVGRFSLSSGLASGQNVSSDAP
jgi:hypothetical protein